MYCKNCGAKLKEKSGCIKCGSQKNIQSKTKKALLATVSIIATIFFILLFFVGILIMVMSTNQASIHLPISDALYPTLIPIGYFLIIIWKKEQKKEVKYDEKIIGIGGWLVIPFLGIIASLLSSLIYFNQSFKYLPLLTIFLIVFQILTLLAFLKKITITPLLVIIFLFINFAMEIFIGENAVITRSLILLIIWSLYLIKSKRVRLTFINPVRIKI